MGDRAMYKYTIGFERNEVAMPSGARILSVGYQPGVGRVAWALVSPFAPPVLRVIRVVATGESFAADVAMRCDFVGTIQDPHGFVWHVFAECEL